jgi:hypothetical protein
MLAGTDLNSAYATYDFEPTPSQMTPSSGMPVKIDKPRHEEKPKDIVPKTMDPNFLTADQKLHMLSNELQKQKEMFEVNKNNNYIDKLLSRKRDIFKLITISFVVLLAISLHYFVDSYLKKFFEENSLSPTKEFSVRVMYPAIVLFLLWNIKVFSK